MNKFLVQIFILNIFFISSAFSQPLVQLGDDDWTSTSANGPCNCSNDFNNGSFMNFFDTGGAGMPYSPNEYEVITLCPDSTGSKMVVAFGINAGYTLNIHPSDTLFVYDGPSINDPLLAAINDSTYPNGINIPASWSNMSGCLTFKFVSDASFQGLGWDANLSCANLIQPFSNHISAFITGNANGGTDTLNDLNPVDTGYVDICFGDIIEFVAQPYFPYEPNGDSAALSGGGYMQSTNYSVTWELSDGTSFTSNSFLFTPAARNGYFVSLKIEEELDVCNILQNSFKDFDGGYALAGMIGHGSSFVARDPNGIRPLYYYVNDEVIVGTSERPPIKTAFGCEFDEIKELKRGNALIVDKVGNYKIEEFIEPKENKACSFERIYFSRYSIYNILEK